MMKLVRHAITIAVVAILVPNTTAHAQSWQKDLDDALAMFNQNQMSEARALANRSVQLNSNNPGAYFLLGKIADKEAAGSGVPMYLESLRRAYNPAGTSDPGEVLLHRNLNTPHIRRAVNAMFFAGYNAYQQRRVQDAIGIFEILHDHYRYHYDALNTLAQLYYETQQWDKLQAQSWRIIFNSPTNENAFAYATAAYNARGKPDSTTFVTNLSSRIAAWARVTKFAVEGDVATFQGRIVSRLSEASPFALRIKFLDAGGSIIGTRDAVFPNIASGDSAAFAVSMEHPLIVGFGIDYPRWGANKPCDDNAVEVLLPGDSRDNQFSQLSCTAPDGRIYDRYQLRVRTRVSVGIDVHDRSPGTAPYVEVYREGSRLFIDSLDATPKQSMNVALDAGVYTIHVYGKGARPAARYNLSIFPITMIVDNTQSIPIVIRWTHSDGSARELRFEGGTENGTGGVWAEVYPNGSKDPLTKTRRGSVDGVQGMILSKVSDADQQIFVPYLGRGERQALLWRKGSSGWVTLATIALVPNSTSVAEEVVAKADAYLPTVVHYTTASGIARELRSLGNGDWKADMGGGQQYTVQGKALSVNGIDGIAFDILRDGEYVIFVPKLKPGERQALLSKTGSAAAWVTIANIALVPNSTTVAEAVR